MSHTAEIVTRPTSTMRQNIHLAPRRMTWNFSDVPGCPVEGDPNLAAFLLALSYVVVVFEDFGIPVVRNAMAQVKDYPALEREAQAFITQEALHSQGHVIFNTMMKERHGIDTTEIDREFKRFMADLTKGTQQEQLAAVAGLEHVIFAVAEWYETTPEIRATAHPEFNRLLLWHCMEETEHTAVVYDMYDHIYGKQPGGYSVRMKGYARGTRVMLRALMNMWKALVPQMAQRMGQPAASVKPWLLLINESRKYLLDFLRYLSPGFTPWSSPAMAQLLPSLRQQMVPQWQDAGGWIKVEVASVTEVSADVRAYELVGLHGAPLPAWTAGAHIDVEMDTGVVRQYSLCGQPGDRSRYRIAVKREVHGKGGSLRLHQEIARGSRMRIGQPRNLFGLQMDKVANEQTLLIAGGIGITPLLAMAQTLHASNADFQLHICSRDTKFLPFAQEMLTWSFKDQVHAHLDTQAPGGRVSVAGLIPQWDAAQVRSLYLCGPGPFIDAACAAAAQAGWPKTAVHFERFAQSTGPKPQDKAFTLHLERSNITMEVPADMTILEAMEAKGLQPANSCREGICGSCICKVNKGEVEHRDAVLTAVEHVTEHKIALCVSRAKGDSLTLDF